MIDLFVPLPYTFEPEPPPPGPSLRLRIAPARPEDERYITCTWLDSFHRAKENFRRPFRGGWKERTTATIARLLGADSTRLLCAYNDAGRIVGWIAWTPGRGISTVHYVYVRHALDGIEWRRRGVMTALLEAADLGRRVAYTHRGEYKIGTSWKRQHLPRPLDEEIVEWAQGRGVAAVYEAIGEWLA